MVAAVTVCIYWQLFDMKSSNFSLTFARPDVLSHSCCYWILLFIACSHHWHLLLTISINVMDVIFSILLVVLRLFLFNFCFSCPVHCQFIDSRFHSHLGAYQIIDFSLQTIQVYLNFPRKRRMKWGKKPHSKATSNISFDTVQHQFSVWRHAKESEQNMYKKNKLKLPKNGIHFMYIYINVCASHRIVFTQ